MDPECLLYVHLSGNDVDEALLSITRDASRYTGSEASEDCKHSNFAKTGEGCSHDVIAVLQKLDRIQQFFCRD